MSLIPNPPPPPALYIGLRVDNAWVPDGELKAILYTTGRHKEDLLQRVRTILKYRNAKDANLLFVLEGDGIISCEFLFTEMKFDETPMEPRKLVQVPCSTDDAPAGKVAVLNVEGARDLEVFRFDDRGHIVPNPSVMTRKWSMWHEADKLRSALNGKHEGHFFLRVTDRWGRTFDTDVYEASWDGWQVYPDSGMRTVVGEIEYIDDNKNFHLFGNSFKLAPGLLME